MNPQTPTNEPVLPNTPGAEIVTNEVHVDTPQRARKRLVEYFDVLIEMHTEYKRNHKGIDDEEDQLLRLNATGKKTHKVVDRNR